MIGLEPDKDGKTNAVYVHSGDSIDAWSQVLAKDPLSAGSGIGALRIRTISTKVRACRDFAGHDTSAPADPAVVLDLDHTVLLPRRS